MKSTLESCVDKMTSQTMTFNHEGIEVNLQITCTGKARFTCTGGLLYHECSNSNVIVSPQLRLIIPDNTSLKETLKIFISTIAQQEDEINGLKMAMSVMALESAAAHNSIKAWTVELLNESQRSLIKNINESKTQIQNFVYNVQGFADNSSTRTLLTSDSLEAKDPGVTSVNGKFHSVNERNARHSSNFYDDNASPSKFSLQLNSYPELLEENSTHKVLFIFLSRSC